MKPAIGRQQTTTMRNISTIYYHAILYTAKCRINPIRVYWVYPIKKQSKTINIYD